MMEAYPVSTLVNSPANDRRECAEPFRDGFFSPRLLLNATLETQPLERSYKGYTISRSADRGYLRVACSDRCKKILRNQQIYRAVKKIRKASDRPQFDVLAFCQAPPIIASRRR